MVSLRADWLSSLPTSQRLAILSQLSDEECFALLYEWAFWARPEQLAPKGNWRVWIINAGRGFGKTRSGAEWTRMKAESMPGSRGAIIAKTPGDVREVMIEGPAGIMATSPPWFKPEYEPTKRRLTWPNGTIANTFSSENYEELRGPNHHWGWVDELAKYKKAQETWDMFEMGLRLTYYDTQRECDVEPQACVTTTPRAIKLLKTLLKEEGVVVTGGSLFANIKNLAPSFVRTMLKKYAGTRLGRQELYAEILEETKGALWKKENIDELRIDPSNLPPLGRIALAIDPSGSDSDDADEVGIVAAGRGLHDAHLYVLLDVTDHYTPAAWGEKTVTHYDLLRADVIVGEANFGGQMVEHTVRMAAQSLSKTVNYRPVTASRGKVIRAEPVAALYEQKRAHHVGAYPELEDELTTWVPNTGQRSPNRLDALVWAATELMLNAPDTLVYH